MKTKFSNALNHFPSGITYDLMEHNTIQDLIYLVQHELDLLKEEPEHYEHLNEEEIKKLILDCRMFLKKFR